MPPFKKIIAPVPGKVKGKNRTAPQYDFFVFSGF
jgi:hypothetical protein